MRAPTKPKIVARKQELVVWTRGRKVLVFEGFFFFFFSDCLVQFLKLGKFWREVQSTTSKETQLT